MQRVWGASSTGSRPCPSGCIIIMWDDFDILNIRQHTHVQTHTHTPKCIPPKHHTNAHYYTYVHEYTTQSILKNTQTL